MAIKNDENLSEFGKRLLALMLEMDCETPKDLAKCLLKHGLVKVKYRGNDISKKEDNAVGSVEKKIRKHLHSEDASCLQGEFVNAYCRFFNCSADYLFGYTEIKSMNTDIRNVCEKTALSEDAVLRLIDTREKGMSHYNQGWSKILESSLYNGIVDNWLQAGEQAILAIQKEVEIGKLEDQLRQATGPKVLDLQCDLEGVVGEYKSANAAYSGILFNISRNMAQFVEHDLISTVEVFRKRYTEGQ